LDHEPSMGVHPIRTRNPNRPRNLPLLRMQLSMARRSCRLGLRVRLRLGWTPNRKGRETRFGEPSRPTWNWGLRGFAPTGPPILVHVPGVPPGSTPGYWLPCRWHCQKVSRSPGAIGILRKCRGRDGLLALQGNGPVATVRWRCERVSAFGLVSGQAAEPHFTPTEIELESDERT
jgi:hypothetical protein